MKKIHTLFVLFSLPSALFRLENDSMLKYLYNIEMLLLPSKRSQNISQFCNSAINCSILMKALFCLILVMQIISKET